MCWRSAAESDSNLGGGRRRSTRLVGRPADSEGAVVHPWGGRTDALVAITQNLNNKHAREIQSGHRAGIVYDVAKFPRKALLVPYT